MVGPTNRNPRARRSRLIASDSSVWDGISSTDRHRFRMGFPPTNDHRYASSDPSSRCTAREDGSLDAYLWSFVGGKPIRNRWRSVDEIPSQTDESLAMSRDLRARGFRFVGPTICYAFMEAVGMVNDHVTGCFRHREVSRAA